MKKLLCLLSIPLLLACVPWVVHAQVQKSTAVSAVVPPNASSYQFGLSSDGQTTVPQDTVLTYHITYGAQTAAGVDAPTTIVAHFSDDLAPGGSDIVDYVIGSASDAYGGTIPVIDLTNRTITWSLASLPAGTINQDVTFQLRTNENYTGLSAVTFTTKATMTNAYVTLPEDSVSQTYQFDQALVTPTLTAAPESTQAPGPTATPGPDKVTPTASQPETNTNHLQITDITFTDISTSTAAVAVTTNQPIQAFIRYGTAANVLNQTTETSGFGLYNTLVLNHLQPFTTYYFEIVIRDKDGASLTSEVFTLKTAKQAPIAAPTGKNAVAITSNGRLITSELLTENENSNALALLMTNTNYQVNYTYATVPSIKTSDVIIRSASGEEKTVHLNQQSSLIYNAALRTDGPGVYTILVRTTDSNGNVYEQKIASLKVMQPLTVRDKNTHAPLSDARVLLSLFNPATHRYEVMPEDFVPGGKNPGFTDANGELQIPLPAGNYQAEVSAWGHAAQTVSFILGGQDGQNFPTVNLASDPFDLTAFTRFLRDWGNDVLQTLSHTTNAMLHSPRFFTIVSTGATSGFILLSYLLFSIRTQIKLAHLVPFLFFFIAVARKRHKETYLSGVIRDSEAVPLGSVHIDIIDPKAMTVIGHTQTTAAGTFHIRNNFTTQAILLLITREGFAPIKVAVDTTTKDSLTYTLHHHGDHKPVIVQELHHLAGSLFEVSLLFSLILELLFFMTLGPVSTLPFLAVSLLNILLWLFYMEEHTRT